MTAIATRPETPPWLPEEGYEWTVVVDEHLEWRLATAYEGRHKRCRHSTRRPCMNVPVAALFRGHSPHRVPWFYCGEHMYGRWIENGHMVMWRERPAALVPDGMKEPQ